MALPAPPVLLITDRMQAHRPLAEVVAAALAGGCRWVGVREKDLPADGLAALVRKLLPLAERHGARLTVHGDPAAAGLCHGVHLPAGGDAARARGLLGPAALVGVSCHTLAEVRAAREGGADYVTFSPVFPTESKPGYGPALGPGALAEAAAIGVPVLALGGVDAGNAAACRRAGAAGLAVMGGIMRAGDPAAAMRELLAALAADATPGRTDRF
ncbi:thiamine phosphate synthase [Indioceanicola profundi]|uniref:thiamine phosphate synthase n=1 Tax=Indioceanicola profundi TaxID=2220096 RepID=UPI00196908A6|nr:thiamine phosphate synthase [Indioceanicola profundi]